MLSNSPLQNTNHVLLLKSESIPVKKRSQIYNDFQCCCHNKIKEECFSLGISDSKRN